MSLVEASPWEVHVIGPQAGYGESIIVKTPQGHWGVIDSYNTTPGQLETNPTVLWLKERGVNRLKFLALTHPHADHYWGILDLFEAFEVEEYWRFGEQTPHLLWLLFEQAKPKAWQEHAEPDGGHLLQRLHTEVHGRVKRKQLVVRDVQLDNRVYTEAGTDSSSNFEIWGLAPSSGQRQRYADMLKSYFDFTGPYPVLKPLTVGQEQPDHNMISTAFLIRDGQSQIVLGGDVLKEGWHDCLQQSTQSSFTATVVKASHHGSTNGYCAKLWEKFSSSAKPKTVITPYIRSKLPRKEGVQHIASYSSQVYTTSIQAIVDPDLGPFRFQRSVLPRGSGRNLISEVLLKQAFKTSRRPSSDAYGCVSFLMSGNGPADSASYPAGELPVR